MAASFTTLQQRARLLQALRRFFIDHHFLEVETPLLQPSAIPEAHIQAPRTEDGRFLQASPELAMKRLLARNIPKIFQISRCFRDLERGRRHLPEFTMLEWYSRDADYRQLMTTCEHLLPMVSGALGLGRTITFQGQRIDLTPPWPRITLHQAFADHASLALDRALADDCFEDILVTEVEPALAPGPVFVTDFPLALGALARRHDTARGLVQRVELYIGGLELANGFSELADAGEQRQRFLTACHSITEQGRTPPPLPEKLLDDLPAMGNAAGIALGVDRLAMLLFDQREIDQVVAFTPEEL